MVTVTVYLSDRDNPGHADMQLVPKTDTITEYVDRKLPPTSDKQRTPVETDSIRRDNTPRAIVTYDQAVSALNSGASLQELGYDGLRLIQHQCQDEFRIYHTHGQSFFYETISRQQERTTWLQDSLKAYDQCLSIDGWQDIEEILNELQPEADSDLKLSETLFDLEKTSGEVEAMVLALDIYNETDNPMAMLNAGHYLSDKPEFMTKAKDHLKTEWGIKSEREEAMLGSIMHYRFCQMGGNCRADGRVAFILGCHYDDSCGLDLVTLMQQKWLSPHEFIAVQDTYSRFY